MIPQLICPAGPKMSKIQQENKGSKDVNNSWSTPKCKESVGFLARSPAAGGSISLDTPLGAGARQLGWDDTLLGSATYHQMLGIPKIGRFRSSQHKWPRYIYIYMYIYIYVHRFYIYRVLYIYRKDWRVEVGKERCDELSQFTVIWSHGSVNRLKTEGKWQWHVENMYTYIYTPYICIPCVYIYIYHVYIYTYATLYYVYIYIHIQYMKIHGVYI